MSCAFCGMPPRDGEGCCTGKFRADTMRRADAKIRQLETKLHAEADRAAEMREALERALVELEKCRARCGYGDDDTMRQGMGIVRDVLAALRLPVEAQEGAKS